MSFTHEFHAVLWFLLALGVLALLRRLLGTFWSAAAFYGCTLVYLARGFDPGMPSSLYKMFAAVALVAVLLYVTSSEDGARSFSRPLLRIATQPRLAPVLALLLVAIPVLVGWQTFQANVPSAAPPPKVRSIHPSPPSTLTFTGPGAPEDGHLIDVISGHNPFRELQTSDPEAFAQRVAQGKVVYYENCFFCHGDTLDGDGHFATAISPVPAKFQAKDTIPMLTEAFLFWRVAKGGPGLPSEGTPWDSTMPVWESFLSEEDIWASILFLYDYTGYEPRSQAAAGAH